jgi:hypothetical protein
MKTVPICPLLASLTFRDALKVRDQGPTSQCALTLGPHEQNISRE